MLNNRLYCRWLMACIVTSSLISPAWVSAEVYKWTDENGRIHYSDKKSAAGQMDAQAVDVSKNINRIPAETSKLSLPTQSSQPVAKQPKQQTTLADKDKGKDVDPRCTLARNIISGRVRLRNGLPTGPHEIEVAQRDIKKFCD